MLESLLGFIPSGPEAGPDNVFCSGEAADMNCPVQDPSRLRELAMLPFSLEGSDMRGLSAQIAVDERLLF